MAHFLACSCETGHSRPSNRGTAPEHVKQEAHDFTRLVDFNT